MNRTDLRTLILAKATDANGYPSGWRMVSAIELSTISSTNIETVIRTMLDLLKQGEIELRRHNRVPSAVELHTDSVGIRLGTAA